MTRMKVCCLLVTMLAVGFFVTSASADSQLVDADTSHSEDLLKAASSGDDSQVRTLLDKGTNVNYETNDGVTALLLAAQNGHERIVETLLPEGAEVNHQAKNGGTALMIASYYGHEGVVKTLLVEGANIDLRLNDGRAEANQATKAVDFSLSGRSYTFDLPDEYCIPTGEDARLASTVASLDPRNMTHFTIVPCGELGQDSDFTTWGMLKTPRGSIGKRIPTRQAWIRDFKKMIKNKDLEAIFSDAEAIAQKSFAEVFGSAAKVGTHMEPISADEYAGYMGGTVSLEVDDQKLLRACAGAATVVNGGVFFYYRYSPYGGPATIAALLKQVESDIARFVERNSP